MSSTEERKDSSTLTAHPTHQGVATKSQSIDDDEPDRDGGDIQSREAGTVTPKKDDDDEPYRDGGDIQSREASTVTPTDKKEAKTSSQDDVERGA